MLQNKTIILFAIITFFTLSLFSFSSVFAQGKKFLQKKPDFNVDLQQPSPGVVLEKMPEGWKQQQCVRALNDFFLWYDDIAGMLESNYQDTHTVGKWDAAVTSINAGSIINADELHRLKDLDFHPGDVLYFHIGESYQKVQEAHQTLTLLEQDLRQAWWWPQAADVRGEIREHEDGHRTEVRTHLNDLVQSARLHTHHWAVALNNLIRFCGVQGVDLPPSPSAADGRTRNDGGDQSISYR